MIKLSAFADEISPDLDEQIRVCKENQVSHFELRGVYGKNVMDFDATLRSEIKTKLKDNGLGVISIGSPIGKVAIDKPWSEHFDRFKLAVNIAEFFEAPLIRVFSYYPAGGEGKGPIDPHRDEVIDRFRQKVEYLKNHAVTLVHENEKGIFGDIGPRCLDLMKSIGSPKLRCAFDFANFVQVGEKPIDNWALLKPYTAHIHIKDAKANGGPVVPAGEGDGNIEAILVDAYVSGYRGFVSLEPHLKVAGHSHGETGPELFKVGADALKKLCRRNGIALAGVK
ncbi:MAG TPA: sugar phosphate isomerase/epimerase family protein [Tepidisphaeraceae bacterium]|jgi:sugar phosphate isomerase/epimerase|nr:sugar phosphate isomerase/epimerase family protein [Tepidisphaeraceae bacterium]